MARPTTAALWCLSGGPWRLGGGAGAQTREIALGCGHILDANYVKYPCLKTGVSAAKECL